MFSVCRYDLSSASGEFQQNNTQYYQYPLADTCIKKQYGNLMFY